MFKVVRQLTSLYQAVMACYSQGQGGLTVKLSASGLVSCNVPFSNVTGTQSLSSLMHGVKVVLPNTCLWLQTTGASYFLFIQRSRWLEHPGQPWWRCGQIGYRSTRPVSYKSKLEPYRLYRTLKKTLRVVTTQLFDFAKITEYIEGKCGCYIFYASVEVMFHMVSKCWCCCNVLF